MAAQLDYGYRTPKGIPGGKADISFDEVITRANEEEDGMLKYGMAAFCGTNKGHGIKLPTASATQSDFQGVVVCGANTEQDMSGRVNVRKGAAVSCMVKGHIWGRLAPGADPAYGEKAYVVKDGDYAGCFTSQYAAYSTYVQCGDEDDGAKEIIADSGSVSGDQIKLSEVTPVVPGYVPAVGDYVMSQQIHGATLDVGVTFGNKTDTENGIAIVERI